MEKVVCDFCGSGNSVLVYQLQDWLTRKPGTFTLVKCVNCGLQYLNPRPNWDELKVYYPDEYHAYRSAKKKRKNSLIDQIKRVGLRRRVHAIARYSPGGKLLDVGCATGEFLVEMGRKKFWDLYGVEPVKFAAEIAKQQTRAQIFEGELLDAHYPDGFFDVVTLWDVLEHTPNPAETLRELERILRPGGILVMRMPDTESFLAKIFGRHWIAYDAPRHLFGFSRHVIKDRLLKVGFDSFEMKYLNSEHFIVFASIGAQLIANGKEQFGKTAYWIAYSPILRAIMAPIFLPIKWLKLGSPAYIARKKQTNVL